jgi:GMP synthase (glutamine-hydrolysing)
MRKLSMSIQILAIQFRKNPTSALLEQQSITREIGESAHVVFVSALSNDVPWETPEKFMSQYQGVILGGSGDFDFDGGRSDDDEAKCYSYLFLEKLHNLFTYLFDHDIPTLGICFGHQMVGAFAGAQVVHDHRQKKSRSHQVTMIAEKDNHFIFSDIPETFYAHYGHKDSLDRVPEGAELLIHGGDQCKVSALRYKSNIYTTQFHPELTFEDMILRIEASPGYLPEGVIADEVFKKDSHSNKIIQNFGLFVAKRSKDSTIK